MTFFPVAVWSHWVMYGPGSYDMNAMTCSYCFIVSRSVEPRMYTPEIAGSNDQTGWPITSSPTAANVNARPMRYRFSISDSLQADGRVCPLVSDSLPSELPTPR